MAIREVIFRGKRTDSGEWVYGYYTKARYFLNKKEMHIIFEPDVEAFPHCEFTGYEEVLPETVGQYTGLTDKNGVKIFEGDICRFKRFNDVHIGKIVFNATTASFVMWYQPIVGAYGEKATQKMLLSVCDDIEVIGNIHDNPELLGGENNGNN